MSQLTERQEKADAWKKKSWLDFCKDVMEIDSRFTLVPLADLQHLRGEGINRGVFNHIHLGNGTGTLGEMGLCREGKYFDIYILPLGVMLGYELINGSRYASVRFTGFPSKAMVYPLSKMSDELERQFNREVAIEATKHGAPIGYAKKGGKYAKHSTGTTRHTNNHKLSTDQ